MFTNPGVLAPPDTENPLTSFADALGLVQVCLRLAYSPCYSL
jgi:hypothetical protein